MNFLKYDIHVQIFLFALIFQDITNKVIQFHTWSRLCGTGFCVNICCFRYASFRSVSQNSEEEDGDDEKDKDECFRCLHFFLRDLCFLGERENCSVDEDEEVLLQRRLLFECLLLYELLAFFCLVALLPLFSLSETHLVEFPVPTSTASFDGPHEGRASNSSVRMDLFPISSVVSAALLSAIDESNVTEYQYDIFFSSLHCNTLLSQQTSRKERR